MYRVAYKMGLLIGGGLRLAAGLGGQGKVESRQGKAQVVSVFMGVRERES